MARTFTGTVRDKTGTLASGRTVQVIRDVDNVCVSKATTDALGEFATPPIITESGTVTTASASVITDSGQAWTVDEFAGHYGVLITSGTQSGQWRKIASNTATALTLDSALPGATSVDDTFEVAALHTLVLGGETDRNALVYAGVMPTGGVIWTPAVITTALWFDAADSSTITLNGGNVSQWDDKSGNARHVTQATSTRQPLLTAAAQNGLDVLTFDGGDMLEATAALHSGDWSAFAVAKSAVSSGARQILCQDIHTNTPRIAQYLRNNAGTPESLAFNTSGSAFVASKAGAVTNWILYGAVHGSSSITAYVDGAAGTAVSTSGTQATGSTQFTVGCRARDTNVLDFWFGDVAEVILVPSVLSLSDRQKIEGYLAHRWGLTVNLPELHPYKSVAP